MSRIGQQPIAVPAGVTVDVTGSVVTVKGPKGELSHECNHGITASMDDGAIAVTRPDDSSSSKSFHGLHRSLIANMVQGVSDGFSKALTIEGVGFRAALQGQTLTLMVGYSHPVDFAVPEGLAITVNNQTEVVVEGADKQQVGEFAARVRGCAPAEPYKGKGVRYKDEHIRRKVGKTVA